MGPGALVYSWPLPFVLVFVGPAYFLQPHFGQGIFPFRPLPPGPIPPGTGLLHLGQVRGFRGIGASPFVAMSPPLAIPPPMGFPGRGFDYARDLLWGKKYSAAQLSISNTLLTYPGLARKVWTDRLSILAAGI